MKKIMITGILLVTSVAMACAQQHQRITGNGHISTITRNIGNFTGVKSMGSYDVYLIPGSETGIKLQGEENILPYIETNIEGSELVIKTKKGYDINTTRPMKIYVTVGDLKDITLMGSGNMESKGTIHGDDMTLKLMGSGDMDIAADVKDMQANLMGSGNVKIAVHAQTCHANVMGSGNMDISGKVTTADASLTGSGNLDAKKLSANDWHTRIAGSGNISR